ncbi:MAG: ArsR/SmtB family transcription factor [Tumebacillaceae bacterium]
MFSVLSDPTRRAIIERLSGGEMSVKLLAEPFEMSLPAISKHLRVLENAGMVSQRKVGRNRYYSLNPYTLQYASEWLNRWSHFWKSQFASLEKHLSAQQAKEQANDPDQT